MTDQKTRKKNALIAQQISDKKPSVKVHSARSIPEDGERVRICRLLRPKQPLNG